MQNCSSMHDIFLLHYGFTTLNTCSHVLFTNSVVIGNKMALYITSFVPPLVRYLFG